MEPPQEIQCPNCHKVAELGANFCQHCGLALRKAGEERFNQASDSSRIDDVSDYAISRTDDPGLLNVTWPREELPPESHGDVSHEGTDKEETAESRASRSNKIPPLTWPVVLATILFVAIIRYWGKSSSSESSPPTATPTETRQGFVEKPLHSIGFTPDEFGRAWNTKAIQSGFQDLNISKIDVEEGGEQNTLRYDFDKSLIIAGAVNKADGTIRFIDIIGEPSDAVNAVKMLSSWAVLVITIDPELSARERRELFKTLGLGEKDINWKTINKTAVRGRITYSVYSALGVIFFGVRSVKDVD